jgi:hypothetical protein
VPGGTELEGGIWATAGGSTLFSAQAAANSMQAAIVAGLAKPAIHTSFSLP